MERIETPTYFSATGATVGTCYVCGTFCSCTPCVERESGRILLLCSGCIDGYNVRETGENLKRVATHFGSEWPPREFY